MQRLYGTAVAALLAMTGGASAQSSQLSKPYTPQRPNAVAPNSQNLMQGPNYWTQQQRRLNVPGADANPSLKRQTRPYTSQTPPAPQAPPRPAETPVPAETPPKPPLIGQ
jgi:hypothetical protein